MRKRKSKLFEPEPHIDKRQREYPSIGDQLDAIMKWIATEKDLTVTKELKAISKKCMDIKTKYPKEKVSDPVPEPKRKKGRRIKKGDFI